MSFSIMVEYYSICYIIPLVTERVHKKFQLHCNICNTMYTGPDALDNLIACWELGRPDYEWEVGQGFITGDDEIVEIKAKTADLASGKHRAWYLLESQKLRYNIAQAALQKLVTDGPWSLPEA
jgi:hypothetical protein